MSASTSEMGPPPSPAKCPFKDNGCISQWPENEKPTWLQRPQSIEKPRILGGLCTNCQRIHPRYLEKLARPLKEKGRLLEAVINHKKAKAERALENTGLAPRYLCASQEPELANDPCNELWKTEFQPNSNVQVPEPLQEDCGLVFEKYQVCRHCQGYALRRFPTEYNRLFRGDKRLVEFECAMVDKTYADVDRYKWRLEYRRKTEEPCLSTGGVGMLCTLCKDYIGTILHDRNLDPRKKKTGINRFNSWFVLVDANNRRRPQNNREGGENELFWRAI
jgi:hypothetical protein